MSTSTTNSVVPGSIIQTEGRSNNFGTVKGFFGTKTFEVLDNTANHTDTLKGKGQWALAIVPRLVLGFVRNFFAALGFVTLAAPAKLKDVYNNITASSAFEKQAGTIVASAKDRVLKPDEERAIRLSANPHIRDELNAAKIKLRKDVNNYVQLSIGRAQSLPFDRQLALYNDAIEVVLHNSGTLITDKQEFLKDTLVKRFYGHLVNQAAVELSKPGIILADVSKHAVELMKFDKTKTQGQIENDILVAVKAKMDAPGLDKAIADLSKERTDIAGNASHPNVENRLKGMIQGHNEKEVTRNTINGQIAPLEKQLDDVFGKLNAASTTFAFDKSRLSKDTFLKIDSDVLKGLQKDVADSKAKATSSTDDFVNLFGQAISLGKQIAEKKALLTPIEKQLSESYVELGCPTRPYMETSTGSGIWVEKPVELTQVTNRTGLQGAITKSLTEKITFLDAVKNVVKIAPSVVTVSRSDMVKKEEIVELTRQVLRRGQAAALAGVSNILQSAVYAKIATLAVEKNRIHAGQLTWDHDYGKNAANEDTVLEALNAL